jgi:hypothetical protein
MPCFPRRWILLTEKSDIEFQSSLNLEDDMPSQETISLPLQALLVRYFIELSRGDYVQEAVLIGKSGRRRPIDFWFWKDRFGFLLLDWARSCGINAVIRADRTRRDLPGLVDRIGVVSNVFSEPAETIASKMDVIILNRADLEDMLFWRGDQAR